MPQLQTQSFMPTSERGKESAGMSEKLILRGQREISSLDIAHALHAAGDRLILPTDEQRAIIESTHFGPTVIIAGAGSGKTETMSQRVLWLVANGVVAPEEILGLTFTRKAAGELATRIRKRLRQLRIAGLLPVDHLTGIAPEIAVEVSTYHSYAGRTLSTHGIRMGIDTDGEPLGEAAAWQLCAQIVNSFTELDRPISHKPNHVIQAVLQLSGELGEHNQSTHAIRSLLEPLEAKFLALDIPRSDTVLSKALEVIQERLALLPMIEKMDQSRLELGQLTFNDQMSYAAKLVEEVLEIGALERAKYRVVLLDEYQDTSYSQVRFLSSLFGGAEGGHHVTAVGDPNQAIYGWRGASSATLETFSSHFGSATKNFDLLTTWRNDQRILDVANLVVEHTAELSGDRKAVTSLAARPDAGVGEVRCTLATTLSEEAEGIADYFHGLWHDPARLALPPAKRSTFAVLLRVKAYIPQIEAALRTRGLKTEVVGMSGLVHVPEIAEIIALLRTIIFPDSGTALARLLLGPRLALGPKDLSALGKYSRTIARNSHLDRSTKLEEIIESGDQSVMESDDFATGSIIEALEEIHNAPSVDFSAEGLKRLMEFRDELATFRRDAHGSLTDIVIAAERFLRLDTELLVRDGAALGRRHIEKFLDEAAAFSRNGATLSTFLLWLDTAEEREAGLKPSQITVSHDAVQILTIHNSKGAEWDVVAVPGLVEEVFPNKGHSNSWLKYSGSLPLALRGDHLQFHDFEFPLVENPKNSLVKNALGAFEEEWAKKKRYEELRLGYVAFTRAKSHLYLSASYFREGAKAKDQSELFTIAHNYLAELAPDALSIVAEIPDENPDVTRPRTAQWPVSQPRYEEIRDSAARVRSAAQFDFDGDLTALSSDELSLVEDAQAIITEMRNRHGSTTVYLPERLSVSTLITLKTDPEALALNIRRPMPRHTDRFAQRGTEFHLWLERYFNTQTLFDDDIFEPEPLIDLTLKELQDKWLASSWAKRSPHEVEAGFETVIAGIVLKGRIDAIYKDGDQYEVVDWKTGRVKSGEELEQASIQLAMYRLAYAKLHNIPIENIRAAFYYVADDQSIYRDALSEEDEIAAIIASVEIETDR
jgi:DNA helicase-2/ATP-dependent DNA helicase PcrA